MAQGVLVDVLYNMHSVQQDNWDIKLFIDLGIVYRYVDLYGHYIWLVAQGVLVDVLYIHSSQQLNCDTMLFLNFGTVYRYIDVKDMDIVYGHRLYSNGGTRCTGGCTIYT